MQVPLDGLTVVLRNKQRLRADNDCDYVAATIARLAGMRPSSGVDAATVMTAVKQLSKDLDAAGSSPRQRATAAEALGDL